MHCRTKIPTRIGSESPIIRSRLSCHHFSSNLGDVLVLNVWNTVADRSARPFADHLRNESHAEFAAASPMLPAAQLTGLRRQSLQAML